MSSITALQRRNTTSAAYGPLYGDDMGEVTLKMTMLFDFFGDLLTEKQREYFDLYHNEDLSLSEIAQTAGISRQGVYDIITRAEKTLEEMEQKTGIVRRWHETREGLDQARSLAEELQSLTTSNKQATTAATKLLTTLEELQGSQ